jgi:UV DNA damage repair endonuclease
MNYGLVCISELLKEQDKTLAFKSMTRKTFLSLEKAKAIKTLQERITHNLVLSEKIITFCAKNGISHYRLNSSVFPLITDPSCDVRIEDFENCKEISDLCLKIGESSRKNNISISLHPDQYNVLASLNESTVNNTIKELDFLCFMLDLMGLPQDYSVPVNVHPGLSIKDPVQEDFQSYIDRFFFAFKRCSSSVRKRLVIENEDKGVWNCSSLFIYFGNYCRTKHNHNFPLTYDNLHDYCNPSVFGDKKVKMEDNIVAFEQTWPKEFIPIFHWSWGKDGGRSHADYSPENPPAYDRPIKWEIELKAKDKAILSLLGKPIPNIKKTVEAEIIEGKKETFNFLYKR